MSYHIIWYIPNLIESLQIDCDTQRFFIECRAWPASFNLMDWFKWKFTETMRCPANARISRWGWGWHCRPSCVFFVQPFSKNIPHWRFSFEGVMELKYFWWNPQWIYPDLVKSQWFLRSSSIFYLAVYPVDILMVQSQFLLKKKSWWLQDNFLSYRLPHLVHRQGAAFGPSAVGTSGIIQELGRDVRHFSHHPRYEG